MKTTLATLAQQYLDIATLESQQRDARDFHSIGVESLREALMATYYAGYAAGLRASHGNVADGLPTEVHTVRQGRWLHEGPSEAKDGEDAQTLVTLPIPETALLANRWREREACTTLIPTAIQQRRIG
jgi:hypothetical protein